MKVVAFVYIPLGFLPRACYVPIERKVTHADVFEKLRSVGEPIEKDSGTLIKLHYVRTDEMSSRLDLEKSGLTPAVYELIGLWRQKAEDAPHRYHDELEGPGELFETHLAEFPSTKTVKKFGKHLIKYLLSNHQVHGWDIIVEDSIVVAEIEE